MQTYQYLKLAAKILCLSLSPSLSLSLSVSLYLCFSVCLSLSNTTQMIQHTPRAQKRCRWCCCGSECTGDLLPLYRGGICHLDSLQDLVLIAHSRSFAQSSLQEILHVSLLPWQVIDNLCGESTYKKST